MTYPPERIGAKQKQAISLRLARLEPVLAEADCPENSK